MPTPRGKTRVSSTRCSYMENKRRCVFTGRGTPPLCKAHRISVQEATRSQQHAKPGDGIAWVMGQFFSGQKVTGEQLRDVLKHEVWAYGGSVGVGYVPDVDQPGHDDDASSPPGFDGERFTDSPPPPPNNGRRTGWRPPSGARTQEHEHEHAREMAARTEMGFGPTEALTVEILRKRYRQLARKYHPDVNQGKSAAQRQQLADKMRALNVSNDILTAFLERT